MANRISPTRNNLFQRFRFAPLHPDHEAKQPLWWNFITRVIASPDNQHVTITSISPNCLTFPVDKRWAGVDRAEDVQSVIAVDTSGKVFINPDTNEWSPRQETDTFQPVSSPVLLLGRITNQDGGIEEAAFPLRNAPRALKNVAGSRDTISGELSEDKNSLIFSRLRRRDRTTDIADFIYWLPEDKVFQNHTYRSLALRLDQGDFTAEVASNGTITLFDENGQQMHHQINPADLVDNEGRGFLQNSRRHLGSVNDFYQRRDRNYRGTEQYRPQLIKNPEGRIMLVLTRIERISVKRSRANQSLFNILGKLTTSPLLFCARPTTAIRILVNGIAKWVPLSLNKPPVYHETPNVGSVRVETNEGTRALHINVPKDLPPLTFYLERLQEASEPARLVPWTMEAVRNEHGSVIIQAVQRGELSAATSATLLAELSSQGVDLETVNNLRIDIFHTRNPEIIGGEFQTTVHNQRQEGPAYREEMAPATRQPQDRDSLFYGTIATYFSEQFPSNRESHSHGIQGGKDNAFDENGLLGNKPIENGTPFFARVNTYFELAEVVLGLPKGAALQFALELHRNGVFEEAIHKPQFIKLVEYCRSLGWLSGVSEDEQGVLALALALGFSLKYQLRLVGFEAQPTTVGEVMGQDCKRYNTALALFEDVLMPFEKNEIRKWMLGGPLSATWKRKYEHFLARAWYEAPKAELARQTAPVVYMASGGRIEPYIVDPSFVTLWAMDFIVGITFYTMVRASLGNTKAQTGRNAAVWSFFEIPRMNQAFFFPSLFGILELFRLGWQYGRFVYTAEQRAQGSAGAIAPSWKNFLYLLIGAQVGSSAVGMAASVLSGKPAPYLNLAYGMNIFWALYAAGQNIGALDWMYKAEGYHVSGSDFFELDRSKRKPVMRALVGAKYLTEKRVLGQAKGPIEMAKLEPFLNGVTLSDKEIADINKTLDDVKTRREMGFLDSAWQVAANHRSVRWAARHNQTVKRIITEAPRRIEYGRAINQAFLRDGNRFFNAYNLYIHGNENEAVDIWTELTMPLKGPLGRIYKEDLIELGLEYGSPGHMAVSQALHDRHFIDDQGLVQPAFFGREQDFNLGEEFDAATQRRVFNMLLAAKFRNPNYVMASQQMLDRLGPSNAPHIPPEERFVI